MEGGLEEDLEVPAAEVLSLCQRTHCLVGNASELVSQERCTKILDAIDPSWAKYGSESFPKAGKSLFGDDFKSTLADRVEERCGLVKSSSSDI
jgi:hypothetical protein